MNNMHKDPLADYDMQREYLKTRHRRVRRGSEDDGSVPLGLAYSFTFYIIMGSIVIGLIRTWCLLRK
jgi:hypothetical protein